MKKLANIYHNNKKLNTKKKSRCVCMSQTSKYL